MRSAVFDIKRVQHKETKILWIEEIPSPNEMKWRVNNDYKTFRIQ